MHDSTKNHRRVYNPLINRCVNNELINEYGLESYSEIEYCVTKETESFKIDLLDWFCLILVVGLLVMIIIGSLYDAQLRADSGNNPEHFRKFPANCEYYNYDNL